VVAGMNQLAHTEREYTTNRYATASRFLYMAPMA